MTDPITLTQDLIRCASVTPLDEGAIDVLVRVLEPLGFVCHTLRFETDGTEPVHNLYARLGTNAPNFCFAGHTDVVPAGDAALWKHDPFGGVIDNGILYGRGAIDMKGGLAAFVAATAHYLEKNGPPEGSISLLISGDEEGPAVNGTVKILEWMAQNGETIDHCLVGEPSNSNRIGDTIRIGRRGSFHGNLTVRGKQGSVAYPHLADNPLPRLVRMLAALTEEKLDNGNEFFPPSNLEITRITVDNNAVNVIPAEGKAHFNIRFNNLYNEASLNEWVRQKLEPYGPYELETHITGDSFVTPRSRFVEMVEDSIKDLTGLTPKLDTGGGTSDARFIKNHCPVLEFGLLNKTIHKVNECTAVQDLEILTQIYEQVLIRYFTES